MWGASSLLGPNVSVNKKPSATDIRKQLRVTIRAERRSLSPSERALADKSLIQRLKNLLAFKRAKRIGIYLAFDGEPDLSRLIAAPCSQKFFAPILLNRGLAFSRFNKNSVIKTNRFGVPEPILRNYAEPDSLDLILTPLVAFNDKGVRLGLGGGHYDRCFRFLEAHYWRSRPILLGIGYEFQRVSSIQAEKWDVRLWGAATELTIRQFS
jgi:5-formyltetrahydrofolate cyclo-ligase